MSYQISRANQQALLDFVARETETFGWKPDAVSFSVAPKTTDEVKPIIAAGVFEDFTGPGRSATFSFAMVPGHRMNRGVIEAFLNLAFHPRGLDLDRLWMQTTAENLISQRAMLAIGAQFQFRKQAGAGNGSDAIVFLMTRPQGAATPAAKASTVEHADED